MFLKEKVRFFIKNNEKIMLSDECPLIKRKWKIAESKTRYIGYHLFGVFFFLVVVLKWSIRKISKDFHNPLVILLILL